MKIDAYPLTAGGNQRVFEFVSEGKKGAIQKLILFQSVSESDSYNLAFGDKDPLTGDLNDLAVSNNGDTEKVLATVVIALYAFFDEYSNASVYAAGSTPARTRLYRMGISRFYNEVKRDFYVYGRVADRFVPFELHNEYEGCLVKRKFE